MPERAGTKRRRRFRANLIPFAVAALCALLLAPSAALAAKPPSLASTAQYKAFIAYVKKLDGLVGQPTSTAQKNTYETELTAKKEAAAHKANALFHRESDEAKADSNAEYKAQAGAVRAREEEALEALRAEIAAKLERAEASYHSKLKRIGTGHRKFESHAHEQIDALRAKKAQATDPAQKEAIQAQITALIEKLDAKRQEEIKKRKEVKTSFRTQKEEIHAARAKKEAVIAEAAEAKIKKISKHWKHVFNEKKAKLNSKRESQLSYLESKLEKGRADIATMPAT
jgi:DNA repair exonuclease SbcCD ATPase subunit